MRRRIVGYLLIPITTAIIPAPPAAAQTSPRPAVQTASFTGSTADGTAESAHFAKQPPRIGDQVEQTIALEMRLATSLRQGDQLLEKNTTTMQSGQRRVATTTEILDGRTQAVLVRYLDADKHVTVLTSDGQTDDGRSEPTTQSIAQPVQGKAYHCRREPGDDGKLLVTDAQGAIPPIEEFEIVAQGMEMVGRPNPLADFLAGRTVAIGQTLALPKEVAVRWFGLGARFGDVTRFELVLREIRSEPGRPCAVFAASIDAASNDSSQMRLQVEGPIVIEIPTCRAVEAKLSGPIAMTESRGTYSTAYQLISTGRMSVAIDATYRDAVR